MKRADKALPDDEEDDDEGNDPFADVRLQLIKPSLIPHSAHHLTLVD